MLKDLTQLNINKPIVSNPQLKDFKLNNHIKSSLIRDLGDKNYIFNDFTSVTITDTSKEGKYNNFAVIPNQYFAFACEMYDFAHEVYKYTDIFNKLRSLSKYLTGSCSENETYISSTAEAYKHFSNPNDIKLFCRFIENNNSAYRLGAKKLINDSGKPRAAKDCFSSVLLTQINMPNASSSIFGELVFDLIEKPSLYLELKNFYFTTVVSTSDIFDISYFINRLELANISFSESLPYRFVSALQTKPFVILTGLSGSGKTKLAEAFSLWISESSEQYCMVSVGADWTNREPLLGFPNALENGKYVKPESGALDLILRAANDDRNKPYFLILDEMNMSHVERYFADFLSAMESTDGNIYIHASSENITMNDETLSVPSSIKLPKNLFIIGTVNIDETTYMFSPKVLDRANVIEFRVSENEMSSFFSHPKELDMDSLRSVGASMASSFVTRANEKGLIAKDLDTALMPFFIKLQEAGAEFGYRSASEISRFVKICTELATTNMTEAEVVDAAIIQKLLPKVHGSRNKIEKILKELGALCINESEQNFQFDEETYTIKYPLSYAKLKQMHKRVLSDGFTSFAEA